MALPINLELIPATIASGQALSAPVNLGAKTLVGIAMPISWDTANLSFQVSVDGGTTWLEFSDGSLVSRTVAAGQFLSLDPSLFAGVNAIKVRSGSAASPLNQSADRVLGLAVKPV
jgi:hypothetical protein